MKSSTKKELLSQLFVDDNQTTLDNPISPSTTTPFKITNQFSAKADLLFNLKVFLERKQYY